MPSPDNVWDQLRRALRQADPANSDGAWELMTSGTVNIVGGGSGGTSSTDNNPFTPSSTSVTPVGGYQGGRQIASGNMGAFGISPSGLLLVDVRAGGAGGGQANLTVRGTANTDLAVGYASGAGPNVAGGAYVPVQGTLNIFSGAVTPAANASLGSGTSTFFSASLGAIVTSVKGSAGKLHGWQFYNPNTIDVFVQVFDLVTASVALGTTAPKKSVWVPSSGESDYMTALGIAHATAISISATTTANGSLPPTSGIVTNMDFI